MPPPDHTVTRQVTVDPERLAKAVEDALGSIEERLQAIERRLPSEEDTKALRVIIERDARVQWLWSSARTWALWVAAIVAGWTVGTDAVRALLKRLLA